jgi:hypothetical protein
MVVHGGALPCHNFPIISRERIGRVTMSGSPRLIRKFEGTKRIPGPKGSWRLRTSGKISRACHGAKGFWLQSKSKMMMTVAEDALRVPQHKIHLWFKLSARGYGHSFLRNASVFSLWLHKDVAFLYDLRIYLWQIVAAEIVRILNNFGLCNSGNARFLHRSICSCELKLLSDDPEIQACELRCTNTNKNVRAW